MNVDIEDNLKTEEKPAGGRANILLSCTGEIADLYEKEDPPLPQVTLTLSKNEAVEELVVNKDKGVKDAAKGKFKRVMIEESSDEREEKAGSNARTFARAVKDREVDVEK